LPDVAVHYRRVAAGSPDLARAAADNLLTRGFVLEERHATHWVLRKIRRRGDEVVTIVIADPASSAAPPAAPITPAAWGPPRGPRVG
jgi:hypothetical protein